VGVKTIFFFRRQAFSLLVASNLSIQVSDCSCTISVTSTSLCTSVCSHGRQGNRPRSSEASPRKYLSNVNASHVFYAVRHISHYLKHLIGQLCSSNFTRPICYHCYSLGLRQWCSNFGSNFWHGIEHHIQDGSFFVLFPSVCFFWPFFQPRLWPWFQ